MSSWLRIERKNKERIDQIIYNIAKAPIATTPSITAAVGALTAATPLSSGTVLAAGVEEDDEALDVVLLVELATALVEEAGATALELDAAGEVVTADELVEEAEVVKVELTEVEDDDDDTTEEVELGAIEDEEVEVEPVTPEMPKRAE